jgi:hypothetical protein
MLDSHKPQTDPLLEKGSFVVNEKALDDWISQLYGYNYKQIPKSKPHHMNHLPSGWFQRIKSHRNKVPFIARSATSSPKNSSQEGNGNTRMRQDKWLIA